MTTHSRAQPTRAPSSARRIADVVYRSLKTAVKQQSARRYDEDVTLRRLDRTSAGQLMQLRLECRDLMQVRINVTATHVGGNVYDVRCEIEDGSSRQVTYALPAGAGTTLSRAPGLGQKLGDFLLGELERELGRRSLSTEGSTVAAR
jgi:hypothetical protein